MVERLNVQVELDAGDGVEQILPLRSGCFETRQRAPLRSVHRRMNGIPAPLDEKRQQAAVIVLEPEGPPREEVGLSGGGSRRGAELQAGCIRSRSDLGRCRACERY